MNKNGSNGPWKCPSVENTPGKLHNGAAKGEEQSQKTDFAGRTNFPKAKLLCRGCVGAAEGGISVTKSGWQTPGNCHGMGVTLSWNAVEHSRGYNTRERLEHAVLSDSREGSSRGLERTWRSLGGRGGGISSAYSCSNMLGKVLPQTILSAPLVH